MWVLVADTVTTGACVGIFSRYGLKKGGSGKITHTQCVFIEALLNPISAYLGYQQAIVVVLYVGVFAFYHVGVAVILASIREEVVYRGLVFAGLARVQRGSAYAVTTILFLLGHSSFEPGGYLITLPPLHRVVSVVLFSLVVSGVYDRTGSLTKCFVVHAASNSMNLLGIVAWMVVNGGG